MDNKNLKQLITTEQNELNQLLNEWDPIGVAPSEGGPKDEYTCFADPIISLLHKGINKDNLVSFLNNHLAEHIGLDPNNTDTEKFAAKIVLWWNKKNK